MRGCGRPDSGGSGPGNCDFERSAVETSLASGPRERILSGDALRLVRTDPGSAIQSADYFGVWNPAPYDPKLHDAVVGQQEGIPHERR